MGEQRGEGGRPCRGGSVCGLGPRVTVGLHGHCHPRGPASGECTVCVGDAPALLAGAVVSAVRVLRSAALAPVVQNGFMTDGGDDALGGLGPAGVRDLVAKGWLTHDGMWFDQAARTLGVETANELNRAAIRAMAPFEVSRLCAALGVEASDLRDADAIARFVSDGISLVTPASVSGPLRVGAGAAGSIRWEWEPGECFAFKGMARFGHLDGYRCGVIYRIQCWVDALGVAPLGEPVVEGCLMRDGGVCSGEITLAMPR